MSKTSKKKTKTTAKKLSPPPVPPEPVKPEEDKAFDFGGLPDRDLKKNLGCG